MKNQNIVYIIAILFLVGLSLFILNNYKIKTQEKQEKPIEILFQTFSEPTTSNPDPIEEIKKSLEEREYTSVIITLNGNELTSAGSTAGDEVKMKEVARIQDAFLAEVTEGDFHLDTRFQYTPQVSGRVNKFGLEKLLQNDKVLRISPNSPSSLDPVK